MQQQGILMNEINKRYGYYLSLLTMTYDEIIRVLLSSHGQVLDNYYKEKSYNRFLKGEIVTITRGKYMRTQEGLYTHHILENKFENLANLKYIKHYKYPFAYQTRNKLVYADLIEHLILHAIITKETNGNFGINGYEVFLKPMVLEWYTTKMIPKPVWMKAAYARSYLAPSQTKRLIHAIDTGPLSQYNLAQETREKIFCILQNSFNDRWHNAEGNPENFVNLYMNDKLNIAFENRIERIVSDYTHDENKLIMKIQDQFKDFLYTSEEIKLIRIKNEIEEHKRKIVLKREEVENRKKQEAALRKWQSKHQLILRNGILKETPRKKILRLMYDLKYEKKYESFKEFESSRITKIRDELVDELEKVFEEVDNDRKH